MGFTVDPERLDDWAALVTGLVDDTDRAVTYTERHLVAQGATLGPLYSEAATGVGEARDALVESFGHLRTLLSGSGAELERTAENYRSAEVAELARIDAALGDLAGPGPGPIAPDSSAAVPMARRADPGTALAEPGTPGPTIPDLLNTILTLSDWISASHVLNELATALFGTNPAEWVAQEVAGDWQSFARAGDACERLADFDQAMAAAIGGAADDVLRDTWRGEAADAAGTWFAGTTDAVDAHAPALRRFATECSRLSAVMQVVTTVIVDLLKYIADRLIWMAIVAAAAAVPGVGVPVAVVLAAIGAAVTMASTVKLFLTIIKRVGDLYFAARAFTSGASLVAQDLRDLTLRPLPAGAYDHPAV